MQANAQKKLTYERFLTGKMVYHNFSWLMINPSFLILMILLPMCGIIIYEANLWIVPWEIFAFFLIVKLWKQIQNIAYVHTSLGQIVQTIVWCFLLFLGQNLPQLSAFFFNLPWILQQKWPDLRKICHNMLKSAHTFLGLYMKDFPQNQVWRRALQLTIMWTELWNAWCRGCHRIVHLTEVHLVLTSTILIIWKMISGQEVCKYFVCLTSQQGKFRDKPVEVKYGSFYS